MNGSGVTVGVAALGERGDSQRERARELRGQRRAARAALGSKASTSRHAHADTDEFWKVWLDHHDFLHRRCLAWTKGSEADATDLLGELLERVLRSDPLQLSQAESPRAWLACVLRNLWIDGSRARTRDNSRHDDVERALYRRCERSPATELWRDELAELVQRAVETLPESLRGPLLDRHVDCMDYAEIARRHDITLATARKRCQLARDRVRALLRESEPEV